MVSIGNKNVNQDLSSELHSLIALTEKSTYVTENEFHAIEWFGNHYGHKRKFEECGKTELDLLGKVIENLLRYRFNATDLTSTQPKKIVPYFIALRILMRHKPFQQLLVSLNGPNKLLVYLKHTITNYFTNGIDSITIDALSNLISIYQKLSVIKEFHKVLLKTSLHNDILPLLDIPDIFIVQCTLHILTELNKNDGVIGEMIAQTHYVEIIVRIISEYDEPFRLQAASLLQSLCSNKNICEQVFQYDCLPILLSVLHDGNHCTVLWHIVWVLVKMCKHCEYSSAIRCLGGIPLLLNLLQEDRKLNDSRKELSSANMHSGRTPHFPEQKPNTETKSSASFDVLQDNILKLKCVCCTALSELSLDDQNTESIVESNGVYTIAKLILPPEANLPDKCKTSANQLQKNAFRALRFLFSMERNRRLFKSLFSSEMFQQFIDVGHYERESQKYEILVRGVNNLDEDDLAKLASMIESLNQQKTPTRFIKEYAVIDLLGSGAFGSVYKVRKDLSTYVALKEVSISIGGKDSKVNKGKQKKKELDEIIRELNMIREQLRHPNIVRYYRTFELDDKLYIEMKLIDGASLQEHFMSLTEKGEKGMGESRIWRVFIQLCLALRYLHKDKQIVHRDLTPNNIMLGENDHVTITDFGLAKQKQNESKMNSVVGTLLYACPEIIKSEPYDEKADIWALGCILYQMAVFEPPFPCDNIMALATKIVEANFKPIPEDGNYSDLINTVVSKCLTVAPNSRPDIVEVSSLVTSPMLLYADRLSSLYNSSRKRLEKERQRTHRHYQTAKRNKQDYHLLYQASLESKTTASVNDHQQSAQQSNGEADMQRLKLGSFCSSTSTSPGSEVLVEDHPWHVPHVGNGDASRPFTGNLNQVPCRALSFDSTPTPENPKEIPLNRLIHSSKGRPVTASSVATLTISPRKVRQIKDPVQQMLHQLHKIILIDQLPPGMQVNFRQRVISRYKRSLFSLQSSSINLKNELKKLMTGSGEVIDSCFTLETSALVKKAKAENLAENLMLSTKETTSLNDEEAGMDDGITYSQLKGMIEKVLTDYGYYKVSQPSPEEYESVHSRFNSCS